MTTALTSTVRSSPLPAYWARHYRSLRDPVRSQAAVVHVGATLGTLPWVYRAAFRTALVTLTVAGAGPRSLTWLSRLPGFKQFVRVTTALALYGALDGGPVDVTS